MTELAHLKTEINKLLDAGVLLDDPESLQKYGVDWTKTHQAAPCLIVLPKTIEEVQKLVKFANQEGLALVPSGGRTGLSGGAVAARGELVIAFDRMNKIIDFNPVDRCVTLQPGVITQQLQEFADEKDLFYPVDFASSGSSQIGGNISTNAGGIKVIRYGMTREWIAGLKVVTGEGKLLDLNKGLMKNASGYDFRHLFIGSEGTLGLVVEASIKLCKAPQDLSVMVLGCQDFSSIMKVLSAFQEKLDLCAYEFFSELAIDKVVSHSDVQRPFEARAPFYVLLEFEKTSEQIENLALETFEKCVDDDLVIDGVMSQSQKQLEDLWALRERISETISVYTPYKNDISVKVSKVADLVGEIDIIIQAEYPEFEIVWYGHIGDGNMHLNILKPDSWTKENFFEECKRVSQLVFEVVKDNQGSISAEHGIGLLKKDYLNFSRSEEEIVYMKAMKKIFDPENIMNPGKMFPGTY